MKLFGALIIILSLAICASGNASAETKETVVKPDEIAIETEGLVCDYCSYGLGKKLKKLPFVDTKGRGNKGILTDIKNQIVTISILPDVKVDLGEIYSSIKSSGYNVINIHFWLSGNMEDKDGKILLSDSRYGHMFELTGDMSKGLNKNNTIELKAHINKGDLPPDKDKPIKIIVDSINSPKETL